MILDSWGFKSLRNTSVAGGTIPNEPVKMRPIIPSIFISAIFIRSKRVALRRIP